MTPSPTLDAPAAIPVSRPRLELRPATPALLAGAGLVGVVSRWALGGAPGLGFTVWTLAVVVGFAVVAGREGRQRARRAWAWACAALAFAAMVAVRDSTELTFLNIATTLGLLLLAAAEVRSDLSGRSVTGHLASAAGAGAGVASGALGLAREATVLASSTAARTPGPAVAVLRGLVLATPVVALFTALLVSGDLAFDVALGRLTAAAPGVASDAVRAVATSLLGALVVGGGWLYALRRRGLPSAAPAVPPRRTVGTTEGLVVLGSVAALFTAFLAVQAAWLFSQDPSARGNGLTYASYARGGFAELTVVAMLTWALVELALARVRAPRPSRSAAVRAVSSLTLLGALVILTSAQWRLVLYDEAYGLTVTRVFAHAAIAFLGAALVVRGVTLWVARAHTGLLVVAAALSVLFGLDVLNPEAVVVRVNLERQTDEAPADLFYLSRLSADAAGALAPVFAADRPFVPTPLLWWRCRQAPPDGVAGANLARARAAAITLDVPCPPSEDWEHRW